MDAKITKTICDYFATQPIEKAWVFGSFSRNEETSESDIDILVVFDQDGHVGLFKYSNIINTLEDKLGRKVDLVVDGTLLPFARESAERDKILIYERAS